MSKNTKLNKKNTVDKKNNKIKVDSKKLLINNKKLKFFNILFGIIIVILLFIFISSASVLYKFYGKYKSYIDLMISRDNMIASVSNANLKTDKSLDFIKFNNKLDFLDQIINELYYYDDKNNKKIEDAMFSAYMKSLDDKYADYFPAKEFEEFTEKTTEGVYYGIGCVVQENKKEKNCTISSVYENSPAEKGGLKVNDVFISIDGVDVKDKTVNDLVELIKGEIGTKREIVVYRKSEDKNITCICYCGKVDIKLVESEIIENNIGLLSINEFTGKSASQFKNEIDKLINNNVMGIIIDLRNNPGGELQTVLEMLDYLIKDNDGRYTLNQKEQVFLSGKTLLVYIKEKEKIVDAAYAVDNHSIELPFVILTSGSTASAAELFSQTMLDYKKAVIVGTRTLGKGVVQNIIPYEDGSAFKFTISEYFPPSGYSINKRGILPQYSLDIAGNEVKYDKDNNIVVYEDGVKYVLDSLGGIISETKVATASNIVATNSNIIDTNINKIATNSIIESKKGMIYKGKRKNIKVYDENNEMLDEDWYIELEDKYQDRQLLQAIIIMKDRID